MNHQTTLTRRGFLAATAPFAAAAAFDVAPRHILANDNPEADKRPNVVLILVDDQGYGDLSCNGNPVLKTPNMDALAGRAVQLTDFHVCPLCSPTRASLMTGRHCRKVGVHGTNGTNQHMAVDAATMAELFANNGFATGMFGKWHLGDRYPLRPMDRGFGESVTFPDGAVSTIPDYWGNDYFDDKYLHNGSPQRYKGYCTDVWFDLALQFIKANKDRPFFCYLPTNAAHFPYLVAEEYAKPYKGDPRVPDAHFYGMIANLDENLGRLRRHLSQLGIENNTILIFMTDNGTAAGVRFKRQETGGNDFLVAAGFNAAMRGKKGSPYDGGHRVPCFVYYPAGGLVGGRKVDQLSVHVDILPTLVDLCRLDCGTAKPTFDGMSLRPWLESSIAAKDRILIESFRRVVMTRRWRLIDGKELYDIQKDPGQQHDVAAEFPNVVAHLTRELSKYRKTEDLRPHYVVIGSVRQNPVSMTAEDFEFKTVHYQWSMATLRKHDDRFVWNVEVAQPGRYKLSLRRWPRETGVPINAAMTKAKWCNAMSGSVSLNAVAAHIRVRDTELSQAVTDKTQEAEFILELAAGPTTIRGWFVDGDKHQWNAYYLYAQRLACSS